MAAARRTAEKYALPFAKPQRALSRLGGQQLFKPPAPADRAFFMPSTSRAEASAVSSRRPARAA
ncbi:MAG: hypothetical protein ACLR4A_12695 [Christensenellales bacterium]